MIRRDITYNDFEGNTHTEAFYFHLSKVELTKLALDYPEGVEKVLSRATASGDNRELFGLIERFILSSYGVRSEDGKGFTKTEELTKKFNDSFAYEQLYDELTSNDKEGSAFILGIMPKGLVADETPPPSLDELMKPKSNEVVVNLPPVPTKE